jgi:hypothetical protein
MGTRPGFEQGWEHETITVSPGGDYVIRVTPLLPLDSAPSRKTGFTATKEPLLNKKQHGVSFFLDFRAERF